MTSEKELKLSCDELKKIVWVCPHCKAEQCLDLSSAAQNKPRDNKMYICGICDSSCDAPLYYAIEKLKEFHKNANDTLNKIFFRVSVNNAKEKTEL